MYDNEPISYYERYLVIDDHTGQAVSEGMEERFAKKRAEELGQSSQEITYSQRQALLKGEGFSFADVEAKKDDGGY